MSFATPTTKNEMFSILNQIYTFYRFRRAEFTLPEFTEIEPVSFSYPALTDQEITAKATALLAHKQEKEIIDRKDEYKKKKSQLLIQKSKVISTFADKEDKIKKEFSESEKKIKKEARVKGISDSDIVLNKISDLETEKNKALIKLEEQKSSLITELESEIQSYSDMITSAGTELASYHNKEITAKALELKTEQDEKLREVTKLNTDMQIKQAQYANSITHIESSLTLKFLEIQFKPLTKEELFDLGYFNDVLDCVNAYYTTLTPLNAYNDILQEPKLALYLDDYYENFLALYHARATS